jgi:hypothetical protein
MFGLIIALVAKVTAVFFFHLLSAPAPLGRCSWAHGVGPSAGKQAAVFVAIFQRQACLPRRPEIF